MKNINFMDFCNNFIEELVDENIEPITESTDFRQLPTWDSLTGMAVIAMVDDKYGVKIEDSELKGLHTVGDIFNLVVSRAPESN